MNEVEAVARAIAPSRWEVMDHYLAQTKRKYDGENAAYDPDQFKDRESMVTAQAAIAAMQQAQEPVAWMYERSGVRVFHEKRQIDYTKPALGFTETPLYAHPPAAPDTVTLDRALVEAKRPIVGIENRTASEVFDIMCDRIAKLTEALK